MKFSIKLLSIALLSLVFNGAILSADDYYIRAGLLVDIENGQLLKDQRIHIIDNRIADVGPWQAPKAGSKILDWSSLTVLPGLMDMHTHIMDDFVDPDPLAPLKLSHAEAIAKGKGYAEKTLMAGFTTIRDLGTYRAFTDVELKNLIDAGKVIGPRMAASGAYITVPQGGGELAGNIDPAKIPAEYRFGVSRGVDDVRKKVSALIEGGATFIKTLATGAVLTDGTEPGAVELSYEELKAAVDEANKHGIYVTAHAHGTQGIQNAIRAGVRSIEHASLIDDETLDMVKASDTWLVMDVYNGDFIEEVGRIDGWSEEKLRKNAETTDVQRSAFTKAVNMDIKIAFGSDAGVFPHGLNARQMAYMVKYGMTPMQAIRAATLSAAELLGWESELGSISKGKLADIIAVEGDLMSDISKLETVKAVIKDGVLIKD